MDDCLRAADDREIGCECTSWPNPGPVISAPSRQLDRHRWDKGPRGRGPLSTQLMLSIPRVQQHDSAREPTFNHMDDSCLSVHTENPDKEFYNLQINDFAVDGFDLAPRYGKQRPSRNSRNCIS